MKIFVAGGAGFIGSNFVRYVLKHHADAEILNYDKLTYSGNLENLKDVENDPRYRFVRGDINDALHLEEAFSGFEPEYVMNFAAESHVDRSIHGHAKEFFATNTGGVLELLEAAKRHRLRKFIQVSTDEVYGSLPLEGRERFSETSPFAPRSPYAASKAGGDLLCRAYHETFGVPVVITRSSNNFGPCQYPEKLIPFFIMRMLEEKSLPLYGDGKNVRDWIYVEDHCAALHRVLLDGRVGEVYNVGAGSELSNLEIARAILRYFKRDESRIEFVADRPGHDRRYALDVSKLSRELGWRPAHPFEEAFESTLGWYLSNRGWIDTIRARGAHINTHIAS